MQSITFTCETITPMFLAGADGITPELRAPSIKGALRFWWRAVNGHLSLDKMRKVEGEIFGSTSQRSKIIIREEIESDDYKSLEYDKKSKDFMLPHKDVPKNSRDKDLRSETKCFPNESTFRVILSMSNDIQIKDERGQIFYTFSLEDLIKLFKLLCTLGGFGKRSRRGFGSVKILATQKGCDLIPYIMPTTLSEIQVLLGNRFKVNGSLISVTNGLVNYPYIKTIEFGAIDSNITTKIINDSHLVKEDEFKRIKQDDDYQRDFNTGDYKLNKKGEKIPKSRFDNALGNGGRFASPIFVSTIQTNEGLKSIITTLNAVPNGRYEEHTHGVLQTEYKNKLKNLS